MDYLSISADIKRFNDTFGKFHIEKGVQIVGEVHQRPYGMRVVLTWSRTRNGTNTDFERETSGELLHQTLFRIREGNATDMAFFLRKLLDEQTFVISSKELFPSTEVTAAAIRSNQTLQDDSASMVECNRENFQENNN